MRYKDIISEYITEAKSREVAIGLWEMCRAALFPQDAPPDACASTINTLLVGFAANPVWVKFAPTLVPLLTSTAQTTVMYHKLAQAQDVDNASKALSMVLASTTAMMLALYSEQPRNTADLEFFKRLLLSEI